jgi:hypothetical protein
MNILQVRNFQVTTDYVVSRLLRLDVRSGEAVKYITKYLNEDHGHFIKSVMIIV